MSSRRVKCLLKALCKVGAQYNFNITKILEKKHFLRKELDANKCCVSFSHNIKQNAYLKNWFGDFKQ